MEFDGNVKQQKQCGLNAFQQQHWQETVLEKMQKLKIHKML